MAINGGRIDNQVQESSDSGIYSSESSMPSLLSNNSDSEGEVVSARERNDSTPTTKHGEDWQQTRVQNDQPDMGQESRPEMGSNMNDATRLLTRTNNPSEKGQEELKQR
ncbi:hypothetical protein SARC_01381 [Sphaeroforma arctica JP610]|uniref:Uncharacterized protein n=1 Tax=Sphaeroforma arctica JP610 TaxID=667725 RepID=A0A0L0GC41_9EUKA|nr:hypothetical protein SARC_01381 [Sphaeroforma arctica JP610]KNC86471.1 hypothetical protein SARC_01381 [Sphaeroforma arctica JP610]|eukprot:XP_014160373.1 hypothetical protein SARC_01381 [Sphaeroforma arctica JP610]